MNTFPIRVSRSQLGPRMRNNRPIENPETDVGEDMINALLDQVSGCNVIVARASLVAKRTAANTFTIYHQAEAWNPDGSQPHPVLSDDPIGGAGRYLYTFAATYLDGEGTAIATSLPAVRAHTFGPPASDAAPYTDRTSARAWLKPGSPLVVKIAVFDSAGSPIDAPFWLEVL